MLFEARQCGIYAVGAIIIIIIISSRTITITIVRMVSSAFITALPILRMHCGGIVFRTRGGSTTTLEGVVGILRR